jgi:HEAT repeat protein
MPWLFKARGHDFHEIARLLAGLMRKIRPLEWTRLYAEFRHACIEPGEVRRLRELCREDAVEMLGVATLSSNGYAREAALRALAELAHPRATPYTLLRLNDWVVQVRNAARETLRALMRAGIADELLTHHYLLKRLQSVRPRDASAVLDNVSAYLRAPESRPAIERALAAKDTPLRLFAYQVLASRPDEQVPDCAIADRAPAVRLWLARRLLASASSDAALFLKLLRDKSSRVSTTMVRALTPALISTYQDVLIDLTCSDARAVREAARWALRPVSGLDLLAEARRRLSQSDPASVAPGVIGGLGEIGGREDLNRILPLLNSPRPRIREAAVSSAVRLAGDAVIGRIIPMLDDSSGRVRRATAQGVLKSDWQPLTPAIRNVLIQGSQAGQVQALWVLAHQGGWNAVPDLLRGLMSHNTVVRDRAWQNLRAWQNAHGSSGWLKPSRETLFDIRKIWPQTTAADLSAPEWAAHPWSEFRETVARELQKPAEPL